MYEIIEVLCKVTAEWKYMNLHQKHMWKIYASDRNNGFRESEKSRKEQWLSHNGELWQQQDGTHKSESEEQLINYCDGIKYTAGRGSNEIWSQNAFLIFLDLQEGIFHCVQRGKLFVFMYVFMCSCICLCSCMYSLCTHLTLPDIFQHCHCCGLLIT